LNDLHISALRKSRPTLSPTIVVGMGVRSQARALALAQAGDEVLEYILIGLERGHCLEVLH
jgi:hypothetical protein